MKTLKRALAALLAVLLLIGGMSAGTVSAAAVGEYDQADEMFIDLAMQYPDEVLQEGKTLEQLQDVLTSYQLGEGALLDYYTAEDIADDYLSETYLPLYYAFKDIVQLMDIYNSSYTAQMNAMAAVTAAWNALYGTSCRSVIAYLEGTEGGIRENVTAQTAWYAAVFKYLKEIENADFTAVLPVYNDLVARIAALGLSVDLTVPRYTLTVAADSQPLSVMGELLAAGSVYTESFYANALVSLQTEVSNPLWSLPADSVFLDNGEGSVVIYMPAQNTDVACTSATPNLADRTALLALLQRAISLDTSGYTYESVEAFHGAIIAAQLTANDETSAQTAVDSATAALQAAMDALVWDMPEEIPEQRPAMPDIAALKVGDTFYLGTYPSTIIYSAAPTGTLLTGLGPGTVNAELVGALNALLTDDWQTDTFGEGSRYGNWQYQDVVYQGVKYRYADKLAGYKNWYVSENYWFRFDPVKWRVLESGNGTAIVMADNALDSVPWGEGTGLVTWEDSILRDFMNSSMLNSLFTPAEQAAIADSYPAGTAATDKLYSLSRT
ncbi:MAG: DUF6273 domain-containing protein [Oscillospiraceae bacterium]|jgi:hypothetical protein|nr:DUF6273 domain-containing protein [Oscillospiraceae bacterium]